MVIVKFKNRLHISFYAVLLCLQSCSKSEDTAVAASNLEVDPLVVLSDTARVVGYLPYYRFAQVNDIAFCKLTHLNIAFANSDEAGQLSLPTNASGITLEEVIRTARAQNSLLQQPILPKPVISSSETKL